MKCCYAGCLRTHSSPVLCPNCRAIEYCSVQCQEKDWKCHRSVCGVASDFTLDDFEEAQGVAKKVLGKGSYGEVRLVQHKVTKQKFAMKAVRTIQILKDSITDASSLNVLLREIAVHKSLTHRHIVKLYDHFEDDTSVYLLLEYAPKGALFYKIRRARKLPEEDARKFFRQTVLGIGFLHKNEIIHRDLKPENLLLDSNECIKICDFGWCVKGTDVRTTFCGTLDYMAPEMFSRGGHGFEIDLWALGVLLYELLHGTAPFTAKNDTEKCRQIMRGEFAIATHVSRDAADLIRGLMQVVPSKRLTCDSILQHPWILQWNERPLGAVMENFFEGVGQVEGVVCAVNDGTCEVYFEKVDKRLQVPIDEVQVNICEPSSPVDAFHGGAGLGLQEEISRRTKEICPDYEETPGRLPNDPPAKPAVLRVEAPRPPQIEKRYEEVKPNKVRFKPAQPQKVQGGNEETKGEQEESAIVKQPAKRQSVVVDESNEALTLRKQELADLAAKLQSTSLIIEKPKRQIKPGKNSESEGGFLNWVGGLFGCASANR